MKHITNHYERRDLAIAALLWHGTWVACALIAVGLLLTVVEQLRCPFEFILNGYDVVKAGVAVFILLPVARVALMLAIFLRERDYAYTMIAALVLTIIAVGALAEI